MAKQLRLAGVEPLDSKFEMVAIGPLFEEQPGADSHRPLRDLTGAAEKELARILRDRNYEVIGTHPCKLPPDAELFERLMTPVDRFFPPEEGSRPPNEMNSTSRPTNAVVCK